MDTTAEYRRAVKQVLSNYARLRPSHGEIRLDVVFDEVHDRYAVMQVGWDRGRRVRGNLVYITVQQGKVYVEYDGLERSMADELVALGIPPDEIILAYLPDQPTVDTPNPVVA